MNPSKSAESQSSSFGWFALLLAVALGLLVGAHLLALSPLMGTLLGCAPLVIYHRYLFMRHRVRLSQAEVDSVYYFGFLVTIAALAIAAVGFSATGGEPSKVVMQFAVGIVATGYAVFARQHLATLVQGQEDGALSDATHHERAQRLMSAMLAAAAEAEGTARALTTAREVIERDVAREVAGTLRTIADEFSTSMRQAVENVGEGARGFRDDLERFRALTIGAGMVATFERLGAASKELERGVAVTGAASLDTASGLALLTDELKEARREAAQSSAAFADLTALGTELAGASSATKEATRTLRDATDQLGGIVSELAIMGEQIGDTPRGLKKLLDQSARVATGVDHLASLAERLSSASSEIESMAQSGQSVRLAIDELSMAMPVATAGVAKLSEGLSDAVEGATILGASLRGVADSGTAASQAAKSASGASDSVGALRKSLQQLGLQIDSVGQEFERSAGKVGGASDRLTAATANSAAKVEADLARASASTADVTRRLVALVDALIDATSAQRQGKREAK